MSTSMDTQSPPEEAVKETGSTSSFASIPKRKLGGIGVIGACAIVGAFWTVSPGSGGSTETLIYYTAKRGTLPINVVESGALESQFNTDIRCELENVTFDRSSSSGSQILTIVPNGDFVEEGQLLVEFDSAPLVELVDQQTLARDSAQAEKIQADAQFDNQVTKNETSLAEAQLAVELAELALQAYEDDDNGMFQINLQEKTLAIEEAKNELIAAEAELQTQSTELAGFKMLYKLGYRGKGDLREAQLNFLNKQGSLVRAANNLATRNAELRQLSKYERQMEVKKLRGDLATARRSLQQVARDNEAELAQAEAAKIAGDRALLKEEERLERYQNQVEKCKIYAPHDGMATYVIEHRRSTTQISEGAFVRERQRILNLPDLRHMQVKTAIHESVLDSIYEGLQATITVDAFPDRKFSGTIQSVGVLPSQGGWSSSDVKVYETIVVINEEVDQLKPGMSTVVEIHVDLIKDVVTVPGQAVIQIKSQNWVYVGSGNDVERRPVELGATNDKFVEIKSGLEEGERVVLNPSAVVDDTADESQDLAPDAGETVEDELFKPKPVPPKKDNKAKGANGQGGKKRKGGGGFDLTKLDKNKDGKVTISTEVPERFRPFVTKMDKDGDGVISPTELKAVTGK